MSILHHVYVGPSSHEPLLQVKKSNIVVTLIGKYSHGCSTCINPCIIISTQAVTVPDNNWIILSRVKNLVVRKSFNLVINFQVSESQHRFHLFGAPSLEELMKVHRE